MVSEVQIKKIERISNLAIFIGVVAILLYTLILQFVYHELPCPLCLLQRIGFICIAFGYFLNFRFGLRPSHYSIALIGAIFSAFVALRQIALHVIPGTGAYGSKFLGLHLYTWSFIMAVALIVITTILLGIDRQYKPQTYKIVPKNSSITYFLFVFISAVIIVNIIAVILQCGFKECNDNPKSYELLKNVKNEVVLHMSS